MRIVYDHQIFSWQQYGGISRYFYEVAARVAAYDGCAVTVLAPAYVNAYLRALPREHVVGVPVAPLPKTGRLRRHANDLLSAAWLRRHGADVVHESYYGRRRLAPAGARVVVSVYDMTHEKFANLFPPGDPTPALKAAAVRRADHVVCISHNTRRDLLEHVPIDPAKVSVTQLGHSMGAYALAPAGSPPVAGPYVLFVGPRAGYKNFLRLLEAMGGSPALRRGVPLVCYGGGAFTSAELQAIERSGLGGAVTQLGGGDELLARLYRHAAAFVYPSLYEGFGIPPLEAMALGCPVVCSTGGSLPEVVGAAAELFDPTSASALAAALERVVSSASRTAELRALGVARAATFSWDRCAAETRAVYRSLA